MLMCYRCKHSEGYERRAHMKTSMKILVADENEKFGKSCKSELEKKGHQVELCAGNGKEVVEKLGASRYDAVVMDVFMPYMDGLEVLEYIKNNLTVRPVSIMLSAVDSEYFESIIMNAGADYIFIKPVNPETIVSRIEQIINWRSSKKNTSPYSKGSRSVEVIISDIMRQIGVPAHIKGYQYLRTAIELCISNPQMLGSVTKILYPTVAKQYGTTPSRVERAIRHAIEVAWDRGDVDVLSSFFGYTIDSDRGKPTNSEFIAMISDKISLSMKTG